VDVLSESEGHITGTELIDRCRERDASTIPSTVYRTLDVLEDLGIVQHCHGVGGREEFHITPAAEHGHLFCKDCGASWDIEAGEAGPMLAAFEKAHGFEADLSHLTVVGRCNECRATSDATGDA
jgi:Fur family ferric uptake transcriptional regulator